MDVPQKIKANEHLEDDQVDEIKAAIQLAGFDTRKEWAEEKGLSPNTLSQILTQRRPVHRRYAEAMNELLSDTHLSEIITRYRRNGPDE